MSNAVADPVAHSFADAFAHPVADSFADALSHPVADSAPWGDPLGDGVHKRLRSATAGSECISDAASRGARIERRDQESALFKQPCARWRTRDVHRDADGHW